MLDLGRQHEPYRAAGWYVDPKDDDQYLYWDGSEWTGQSHPIAMKARAPRWFIAAIMAAVVVIALLAAAIVVGASSSPAALPTSTASSAPAASSGGDEGADVDLALAASAPKRRAHHELSERDLAGIVADPGAHQGENIIVHAEVTQFDSATGDHMFRAAVVASAVAAREGVGLGHNALFSSNSSRLVAKVSVGDDVKIWATVVEPTSYQTQAGATATVPAFRVNHIRITD